MLHYDLAWNPTRHEQREGRVDRYGQPKPKVQVVTFYGADNPIDGIVLDVLLRKHQRIRSSLGISVPVPIDSDAVLEAVLEGLVLRGSRGGDQLALWDEATMRPTHRGTPQELGAQRRAREAQPYALRSARHPGRRGRARARRGARSDRLRRDRRAASFREPSGITAARSQGTARSRSLPKARHVPCARLPA